MPRYRGVNGVARKVDKRYRGVNGVARTITKSYRGVSGVARMVFGTIKPAGTYWLIDATGIKEYDNNGSLVASSATVPSNWTCPESGNYSVELHSKGGRGGDGAYENYFSQSSGAGGGGGGGGSGALITVELTGGYVVDVQLDAYDSSRYFTKFGRVKVMQGEDGEDGYADGSNPYYSEGGAGGSYGEISKEADPTTGGWKLLSNKNIANNGKDGEKGTDVWDDQAIAEGGYGGHGGYNTDGYYPNDGYGYGGKGGNVDPYSHAGYMGIPIARDGEAGQPGAIIIRKL